MNMFYVCMIWTAYMEHIHSHISKEDKTCRKEDLEFMAASMCRKQS